MYPYDQQITMHTHDQSRKGFAVTALVLGVVGVVFGLIPITYVIALGAGVLALIFGVLAWRWGMGKAGVILGVIAVGLGIWGAVIVNKAIDNLNQDLNSTDAFSSLIYTNPPPTYHDWTTQPPVFVAHPTHVAPPKSCEHNRHKHCGPWLHD